MIGPLPRSGGSRFLYEPFDATAARVDAYERVTEERWRHLERRLAQLEGMLERLEKRLWLVVYGAASVIVAELFLSLVIRTGNWPGQG